MVLEEEQPNSSKLHEWNILPKAATPACTPEPPTPGSRKRKNYLAPITWTVGDISKAGCLLTIPPQHVDFDDEQEMRRVYSLIYDVFRYKNVLSQALNDVSFFQIYCKLEHSIHHVWLLFFDLYHRSFNKRETKVMAQTAKLFDSVGLSYAENALWSQRVRLAAAVARLRIKHNALSLDELLPAHLKDERVTEQAKHSPVTCWVNCIKVSDIKEVTENIEKTFDLRMVSDLESLEKNTFKWDRHCPQVMAFHSSMRGKLARSRFVKTHLLVVQDKSFCRGAATFGKILADLGLTGSVIQTHVNSPRTTAYLATLLTHNEKIKKLMAFSAGRRKLEYEHYFTELGVTNIRIFSDRLIDSPPDAAYMEEVVAVFATPPNSYSAVTDPIDLVCSRGGDLSMLQVLTESDETKEGKQRVMRILEEQKKTLKFAMSRPQIQFVLYETHSELDIENDEMVSKTLKDINRLAKLQHAAVLGKTPMSDLPIDEETLESQPSENRLVSEAGEQADMAKENSMESLSLSGKLVMDSKEKLLDSVQVPDTDIFTTPDLPNLCPNENSCINFRKEGCFLSLIQRKEIIRLDDKYMIQMAENRGLFGSTTTQSTVKSKGSKASRKNREKSERKPKSRKKLQETEMRDEWMQTIDVDDEEMDEGSDGLISVSTSMDGYRPSSRSILGRLTSAHIRQFVSPDFKQDAFQFHAPSLFLRPSPSGAAEASSSRGKLRGRVDIKLIKKLVQKASRASQEKGVAGQSKKPKRQLKKAILDRIRSPTLSFILKSRRLPEELEAAAKALDGSPCERFNRRNGHV
uniref:SAM-dependent MTase RsmB/NOP-type domain-containing protein n=1 Tax=Dendroctonus ponderosae TaxID=77166 RepID=A0AAR5PJ68_DENPD